jgi:hypothetical protein
MAYIYNADIYCTECGEEIRYQISKEGNAPEDPDDEYSYDSDEFPKWCGDNEESDCPKHCASGKNCINAITLPSGVKIGSIVGELTRCGVDYVKEAIENDPDSEVVALWQNVFRDYL